MLNAAKSELADVRSQSVLLKAASWSVIALLLGASGFLIFSGQKLASKADDLDRHAASQNEKLDKTDKKIEAIGTKTEFFGSKIVAAGVFDHTKVAGGPTRLQRVPLLKSFNIQDGIADYDMTSAESGFYLAAADPSAFYTLVCTHTKSTGPTPYETIWFMTCELGLDPKTGKRGFRIRPSLGSTAYIVDEKDGEFRAPNGRQLKTNYPGISVANVSYAFVVYEIASDTKPVDPPK